MSQMDDAPIVLRLAEENYKNGNYERAIEYYSLAAKLNYSKAYNRLGLTYDKMKNYQKAEEHYLLAIEKGVIIAIYNLACFYKEQKRFDEAKFYFATYLKNYKVDTDIKNVNINIVINEFLEIYSDDEKIKMFSAL